MRKKALITGITGQDGSYLAEFLLSKKYEVHGIIRRSSNFNTQRIDHIYQDPHEENRNLYLHYGDITDSLSIATLIRDIQPDEVYNFAAQTHVKTSFNLPEYTGHVTGLGVTSVLESLRQIKPNTKFYQAASSEMFGKAPPPQDETTPFQPTSPYAIAKLYGYYMTINYREAYNMYCANGILFNHESPRRGITFVTRKISLGIANILIGKQDKIFLGNLNAKRDWGFAPDYMESVWLMMQQNKPDDFVIGTGESHSVETFLSLAFDYVNKNYKEYVVIDPRYYRPIEVDHLQANAKKAQATLGWKPKITFDELIKIMIDSDLKYVGLEPIGDGLEILKKKGFNWTKHALTNG